MPRRCAALDKALAAEKDHAHQARDERGARRRRARLRRARATQKLEAIAIVRDRGDRDALGVLQAAASSSDAEVKAAATAAAGSIDRRSPPGQAAQNVWYGISLGSVLLLAAIGLAITFGTMGVINMAHGEMVMLGAYTTFVVQQMIRSAAPQPVRLLAPVALPLAFLVAGRGRRR